MAASQLISCKQYQSFLTSQEPVYDQEILRDIRPTTGDLMGYYVTAPFDAYTGVQHSVDRFHGVFPNVTRLWNDVSGTACAGTPCDPTENKIGWGWSRETYGLEEQSWGTQLLCFDQIMTKTRAKEHFRQIIDDILRPATTWIMTYWLMRKAAELADTKYVVAPGLPAFTFTWDPGGYTFMTTTQEPTGMLTPDILRRSVRRHYFNGAIDGAGEGYDRLELHTDEDTFWSLQRQDETAKNSWQHGDFKMAAKEYWKYGFTGFIGDFMVKCLRFPMRFLRVSANRFQLVLPYTNIAADDGIKSVFNSAYDEAQYQFSLVNNRRAIRVMPFKPGAVNSSMPFLVRDYGGRWNFVNDDLGADAAGRPIDNSRKNKGKFIADYRLAAKPEHTEWIDLIFHMVDKPCVVIVPVCNDDPGYPEQFYDSDNDDCECPAEMDFVFEACGSGAYAIEADSIKVNGVTITHDAVANATLAGFVAALQTAWDNAGYDGTWAVVSVPDATVQLTWTGTEHPVESVEFTFLTICPE